MPLASQAAENAVLDACYGDGRAPGIPASFLLRLYDEDPRIDGAEITALGYSAQTLTNDSATFPAASGGIKESVKILIGTAGEDWPTVRWWLLEDAATGIAFETCELAKSQTPAEGTPVRVTLALTHDSEAL